MTSNIQFKSIKFWVNTSDHAPAHVHVKKDKKTCKVNLKTFEVFSNKGFKDFELTIIRNFVKKHKAIFIAKWEEIYGEN